MLTTILHLMMLEDFNGLFPFWKRQIFEEEDLYHIKQMSDGDWRKMMEVGCP